MRSVNCDGYGVTDHLFSVSFVSTGDAGCFQFCFSPWLIVLVRPWLLFLSYLRLPTADFTDEYANHTMLLFIMIIPLCSVLTNDMLCYDILSFFFFKCLPLLCQVLSLSVSNWNFHIVENRSADWQIEEIMSAFCSCHEVPFFLFLVSAKTLLKIKARMS